MSLFRRGKDKDRKDTKDKTAEIKTQAEEPEQLREEKPYEEEYTDISEAADDSFSQPQNNKMEEIYSTRDKQVKFRRKEPLAEEAAARRKEAAKDDLIRGKLEFSSQGDEEAPNVKLEAELGPDTIVSDEIIEDVVDVKKLRNIYVQDIEDIDVSLDPMESVKEYEKQAQRRKNRKRSPMSPPAIPSSRRCLSISTRTAWTSSTSRRGALRTSSKANMTNTSSPPTPLFPKIITRPSRR